MLRVAFAGTPDFAVPTLRALAHSPHTLVGVLTRPDRPAGRGREFKASPVKRLALELKLPLAQPAGLQQPEAHALLGDWAPDALVVVAYGLILPPALLALPRLGCINIHASLLPRWRGAGPIQAAILAGDAETGVTIMQMDAGLDTGPTLLRETVPITSTTTAAVLHDALAAIGARLILRALAEDLPATPQPTDGVSYAPKLTRADARIDWTLPAPAIERRVRAFDPWPGTFTLLDGATLKVLGAAPAEGDGVPGTVLDDRLTVACGSGALRLTRVQLAGRAPLDNEVFLRGHLVPAGARLGG